MGKKIPYWEQLYNEWYGLDGPSTTPKPNTNRR